MRTAHTSVKVKVKVMSICNISNKALVQVYSTHCQGISQFSLHSAFHPQSE